MALKQNGKQAFNLFVCFTRDPFWLIYSVWKACKQADFQFLEEVEFEF